MWKHLFMVGMGAGLAACGIPERMAQTAPPALNVLQVREQDVQARIHHLIENRLYATDFYPKVERLRIHALTPGVRYRFVAEAMVSLFAGKQPYRLVGTYDVRTDILTYTERIPLPTWSPSR